MNHAYIRPGGLAQDLPPGALEDVRGKLPTIRRGISDIEKLSNENPVVKARLEGVGYLDLSGCMALGVTGPVLRSAGLPHDLRRSQPYCGYATTTSTSSPGTPATPTDGCGCGSRRCKQSLRIVEQCLDRLQAMGPGPVMVARQEDRLAGPAGHRQRRHGQLPRPHPRDHGHLDGGPDPPLQAGHRGLPGAGRARSTPRSSRPAASSASTSSPTAGPARTGRTSGTRPSTTCRPWRRCARAARSPTSIVAVASLDPVMGGVDR